MSEAVKLSLSVNQNDLQKLRSMMAAYGRVMRKEAPQIVKDTAGFLGRSLSASSRKAKKVRKVDSELSNAAAKWERDGTRWKRTGLQSRWYAIKWFGQGQTMKRYMPFSVRTQADALLRKEAQIGRRGLAKAAWRSLGSGRPVGGESYLVKRGVQTGTKREDHLREWDPYLVLRNRIGYAENAFFSRGKHTIDSVARRATSAMERVMLRKISGVWAK
jgi:hypothetical protein